MGCFVYRFLALTLVTTQKCCSQYLRQFLPHLFLFYGLMRNLLCTTRCVKCKHSGSRLIDDRLLPLARGAQRGRVRRRHCPHPRCGWRRPRPADGQDAAPRDATTFAGQQRRFGDGGSPLSCAVGYGQWAAARRLVERGARTLLWHEAALGLLPAIKQRVEADPPPQPEELSGPFWNSCYGGQLAVAQYLLAHGADLNWPAPWSGQTRLDIAKREGRSDVVVWLLGNGAIRGSP